ncbi:solute carrier family 6 protein [Decorospora gaudefroyi]|uniref:Solute carrier family 6 protein n=1 Tax=Decorospora gaudefroyi TaxID=184978 RepID=A0A6A5K0Y7_9PLEO|nr:solute carrier family 6 protein [Decorospora gaudefroyi]
MDGVKRILRKLSPEAKKSEDGRDMFSNRIQFVLCAMGGAVGLGNLLRFPSVVYNNYGLQFFIPYLIALFFVALPLLVLEISLGTVYRGGPVLAWHSVNKRAKGLGLSVVFNGYVVVTYYVPLLAWIMKYFRRSFQSPLPWKGQDLATYFTNEIVSNLDPASVGSFNPDGSVASYTDWVGTAVLGETAGWAIFTWFVTWLCVFRGVGMTGRVIYVTMGLPLVLIIVLIGRGTSLPNAGAGIKLYFGTWRTSALESPQIWQAAFGQIFFSIGVGFGYFTSWASYCSRHSNAVQDALIIGLSNSAIEVIAAFSVFGVIGYLGIDPSDGETFSTFVTGFITYPEALAQMPGAPFWAVLFFFTLFLLGLTSAFSLLEVMTTLIMDTDWGRKVPRWAVCTTVAVASALISLIYCTEFGLQALDAVDTYVNDVALFFVVWCECLAATSLYRCRDVVHQVGWGGYLTYTLGFVIAQVLGIRIAYVSSPGVGAGVGFAFFFLSAALGVCMCRTPGLPAPRFFGNNSFLSRFWWVAFYPGNQLTRDMNVVIGVGKNWNIPWFWAPIMKYISGPILAIVLSFAYPKFIETHMFDPIFIYGFSIVHLVYPTIILAALIPSWFNWIIPSEKIALGSKPVVPMETIDNTNEITRAASEEQSYGYDGDQAVETKKL